MPRDVKLRPGRRYPEPSSRCSPSSQYRTHWPSSASELQSHVCLCYAVHAASLLRYCHHQQLVVLPLPLLAVYQQPATVSQPSFCQGLSFTIAAIQRYCRRIPTENRSLPRPATSSNPAILSTLCAQPSQTLRTPELLLIPAVRTWLPSPASSPPSPPP
jgi:hypothetical protein